jgi:hypothetical protein
MNSKIKELRRQRSIISLNCNSAKNNTTDNPNCFLGFLARGKIAPKIMAIMAGLYRIKKVGLQVVARSLYKAKQRFLLVPQEL